MIINNPIYRVVFYLCIVLCINIVYVSIYSRYIVPNSDDKVVVMYYYCTYYTDMGWTDIDGMAIDVADVGEYDVDTEYDSNLYENVALDEEPVLGTTVTLTPGMTHTVTCVRLVSFDI